MEERVMNTLLRIAAIALLLSSQQAGWTYAQQAANAPPAPPQMLFSMKVQNDARSALTQAAVTTPNVDLQLLGDGRNIVIATGSGANLPRLFFGLCQGPCGFALRDRSSYFDLRGKASIRLTTIVSGFHRVRPVIKLADGTVLIADQAEGSTADYHRYDISFGDCRWLKLDPVRGVTLGGTWVDADLSRVDAVGYFDVLPGSGEWSAEGLPVEKQPIPPAGGWIAVTTFELWGKPVSRS
jgi:hypothetical protein